MPNLTRMAAAGAATLLKKLIARLEPGDASSLARSLMTNRFDGASRAMAFFCEQATHSWRNRRYEVDQNGEAALLARLRPFAPKLLIDVGGNIGDWSIAARDALPDATIHAFEIAESTAAIFHRNAAPLMDRIVLNIMGLGDREGEIALFLTPENNTAASTVRNAVDYAVASQGMREVVEIKGRIITGDSYLRQQGINHVDLLKIDVEGGEWSVLTGFRETFARGAIDMVQFEYGALNLSTREFLGDFFKFFTDQGFVTGKLYPEGVAFKSYDLSDEDFCGPNYVACKAERRDIIEALRCPVLTVLS